MFIYIRIQVNVIGSNSTSGLLTTSLAEVFKTWQQKTHFKHNSVTKNA